MKMKHITLLFTCTLLTCFYNRAIKAEDNKILANSIIEGDLAEFKNLFKTDQATINDVVDSGNPLIYQIVAWYTAQRPFTSRIPVISASEKYNNRLEMIRFLVQKGADINAIGEEGNTALHKAVLKDQPKVVELLLELRADTSIQNNAGLTPYAIAVEEGYKEIKDLFDRHKMRSGLSSVRGQTKNPKDVFMSSK